VYCKLLLLFVLFAVVNSNSPAPQPPTIPSQFTTYYRIWKNNNYTYARLAQDWDAGWFRRDNVDLKTSTIYRLDQGMCYHFDANAKCSSGRLRGDNVDNPNWIDKAKFVKNTWSAKWLTSEWNAVVAGTHTSIVVQMNLFFRQLVNLAVPSKGVRYQFHVDTWREGRTPAQLFNVPEYIDCSARFDCDDDNFLYM